MTALHHRRCAGPNPRRWQSCQPQARRSAPGCSWCGGKGSALRAPVHHRDRQADQADCPSRPVSGRGRIPIAAMTPDCAARAEPFPARCVTALRGWSTAAVRAHAEFLQRSISLHAADPAAGARCRCAYARGAQLLLPRKPGRVCTHCLGEGPRRSILFRELLCGPRSACESTQPMRAIAEIDWSAPYPRATALAEGAPSRCTENQTDWLRNEQRR